MENQIKIQTFWIGVRESYPFVDACSLVYKGLQFLKRRKVVYFVYFALVIM
jgi:hypothetical protein